MKMTEALLETDQFVEQAAHMMKTKATGSWKQAQKLLESIKRFSLAAEKIVPTCSSPSSKSPPTDIFDNITNVKT